MKSHLSPAWTISTASACNITSRLRGRGEGGERGGRGGREEGGEGERRKEREKGGRGGREEGGGGEEEDGRRLCAGKKKKEGKKDYGEEEWEGERKEI